MRVGAARRVVLGSLRLPGLPLVRRRLAAGRGCRLSLPPLSGCRRARLTRRRRHLKERSRLAAAAVAHSARIALCSLERGGVRTSTSSSPGARGGFCLFRPRRRLRPAAAKTGRYELDPGAERAQPWSRRRGQRAWAAAGRPPATQGAAGATASSSLVRQLCLQPSPTVGFPSDTPPHLHCSKRQRSSAKPKTPINILYKYSMRLGSHR